MAKTRSTTKEAPTIEQQTRSGTAAVPGEINLNQPSTSQSIRTTIDNRRPHDQRSTTSVRTRQTTLSVRRRRDAEFVAAERLAAVEREQLMEECEQEREQQERDRERRDRDRERRNKLAKIEKALIRQRLEAELQAIDSDDEEHDDAGSRRALETTQRRTEQWMRDTPNSRSRTPPPFTTTARENEPRPNPVHEAPPQCSHGGALHCRQAVPMPNFDGTTGDWLAYKSAYDEQKHRFTKLENLARLRRSLTGKAKASVCHQLIGQGDPDEVMETLNGLFGRSDQIVEQELAALRRLPKMTDVPKQIHVFASQLRNTIAALRALGEEDYLRSVKIVQAIKSKIEPLMSKYIDYADLRLDDSVPEIQKLYDFLKIESSKIARSWKLGLDSSMTAPESPANIPTQPRAPTGRGAAVNARHPKHFITLAFSVKEGVGQNHAFRSKCFRKARPCHWCHQPILNQGSCCRVCKYVCHTACENKIPEANDAREQKKNAELAAQAKAADAARYSDTSWHIHRTWTRDGSALPVTPPPPHHRAPPTTPNSAPPVPAAAAVVSRKDLNGIYDTILPRAVSAPATPAAPAAFRDQSGGGGGARQSVAASASGGRLDLCYVAERMLALYLPGRDVQAEAQAAHMLSTKHGQHFMVFEVSGDESGGMAGGGGGGAAHVFGRARSLGWGGELAPPLERLCAACKQIDRWLAADPRNVAVLLAWENRERLGVIVAAYMHYSAICGAAEHALDRYAMRRYLDDRVPVFRLPSNKRYIDTFAGLLAGQIRVNAAPLQLTHVSVAGAPPQPSHAFLKIYENLTCVYTSGVYVVGGGGGWTVGVGRLALRGDVLVRAYRRASPHPAAPPARHLVFACQFHTCAVADHTLSFTKHQLDYAAHDPLFPTDGAVELVFARGAGAAAGAPPAPTPAATLRAAPDALARHDSLEHLRPRPLSDLTDDEPGESGGCAGGSGEGSGGSVAGEGAEGESAHTFGPLDGSIYATVVRPGGNGAAPASPLSASMDSGISSAGRRAAPSPPDELDALLGDMLRTVSALPDAVPHSRAARPPDIPYHARTDSAPFTYGAPGLQPGMLRASNRLASPELVRRALGRPHRRIEDDEDEPDRARAPGRDSRESREWDAVSAPPPARSRSVSAVPPEPSLHSPLLRKKFTHEDLTTTTSTAPVSPVTPLNGRWLNGGAEWSSKPLMNGRKLSDDGWRSDGGWETQRARESSGVGAGAGAGAGGGAGLTWLQRQQHKLRERREARARGVRLPLDWGTNRHVRHSASHRVDGYTSDTTAFADDDDDFSVPLHVQTVAGGRAHTQHNSSLSPAAPDRTSSKKFMFSEKLMMQEWSNTSTSTAPPHPGLLSLAEPINADTLSRERSASWSRTSASPGGGSGTLDSPRAATPAFPTHPRTPYPPTPTPSLGSRPPRSPPVARRDRGSSPEAEYRTLNGSLSGASRRSSLTGEPQDVSPDRVRFARDTSHYWYKPNISRDEAISLLSNCSEGAFIVRDSNSFPGAFGLAVRAAGVGASAVRHFLVEPTARGVRLRGCPDEPVFSSLSALVYQHTVTQLALPTRLRLPDRDLWPGGAGGTAAAARALLATGAACHVLLLGSDNTEALTGPAAVRRAVTRVLQRKGSAHVVHFKVFGGGVTLTDAARKLFFRRHYPAAAVSYAGLDPDDRRYEHADNGAPAAKRIFAFVARAQGSDNQCHVFAELEPEQPATAIVNFVNKALLGNTQKRDIL